MFKSNILLGLAFVLGAVSAVGNNGNKTLSASKAPAITLTLYTAWDLGGVQSYCQYIIFDQCYTLQDAIVAGGLSSAKFNNNDFWVRRFTVTLYSGSYCNHNYDRWTFTETQYNDYSMNQFPTLNDQVRSFKVANFKTSTESGNIGAQPEDARMSECYQK
ncbi:unnamed protein product [Mortierella alpina]